MPWNSRTSLQGDQHDPQAVVLDEGLGVLARLPPNLAMELLQFRRKVEFEVRPEHWLWMWPSVFIVCI
jgi:hypothetical protein